MKDDFVKLQNKRYAQYKDFDDWFKKRFLLLNYQYNHNNGKLEFDIDSIEMFTHNIFDFLLNSLGFTNYNKSLMRKIKEITDGSEKTEG